MTTLLVGFWLVGHLHPDRLQVLLRPLAEVFLYLTKSLSMRGFCEVVLGNEHSDLLPYFVTDLSYLMRKHQIDVWCHGHTHTNNDFRVEGRCRVISNQLGYPGERGRPEIGFRPELIIAL